jgi:hypothetical protein
MHRVARQLPVEAHVVVPLAPLAELVPHEHELLSGVPEHVAVQRSQVRELLPHVAGHLPEHRLLRCTTSSCENGRMKRSEYAYIRLNVIWLWW